MNLTKEVGELEEKALKYEHLKERYVEYAQKISRIIEELEALKKEIDPYTSMNGRSRNPEIGQIKAELYEVVMKGTEVSTAFIEKMYPQLSVSNIRYLLSQLKQSKNVDFRKEGVKLILFARKVV